MSETMATGTGMRGIVFGCCLLAAWAMPAAAEPWIRAEDLMTSASVESSTASDVSLLDCDWTLRWKTVDRDVCAVIGVAPIAMDYIPSDANLLGQAAELDDTRTSWQFTWREALEATWRWNVSAGGYEGFTDYRSLWLEEHYRQIFSGVPGYLPADVRGSNVSIGGTWEYLPQCGMINWSIGWQNDDVSPSYEKLIGGPLVRGTSEYETWRFGLGSEHVLGPRVRFKQDLAAYQTTARDWRYVYRGETAWAVTDDWSVRGAVEGSRESDFHSGALTASVEKDWDAKWFLGLQLRGYRDNGQIIDPAFVSSSSPALDSVLLLLTLRHAGPQATWRVAVGPYLTRYGSISASNRTFDTLYRDRDWLSVQAACTWMF